MFQIKLKRLREAHKLSQAKLAEAIGVSQSTVGMWESGKNTPEYSNLVKIADVFDIPLSELFDDESTKKEPAEGKPIAEMDDRELLIAFLKGETLEFTDEMIKEIRHHARYVIAREREKDAQNETKDA